MRQQKKIQSIKYSLSGFFSLCVVSSIWLVIKATSYTTSAKIESASAIEDQLPTLLDGIMFTLSLLVLTVGSMSWFMHRLVREVLERRDDNCDLYLSEAAVKASTNGILITDDNANVVFVNPAFEEITGYSSKEVVGGNPRMLSSGRHDKVFFQNMWRKIEKDGHWEGEIWNRHKSGELYLEWINIIKFTPSLLHTGQYLAIFSDITERKQEEGLKAFQATHDPLTKLPNRNLFFDRVETEMAECERSQTNLVMLFVDLDEFKSINDTHGHIIGDQVLIDVSKRIAQAVRQSDSLCRYGGDEFIVLLHDITDDRVWKRIANVLLSTIGKPYAVKELELRLTASIGIAIHRGGDGVIPVTDFIEVADTAMYSAKISGKNRYFTALKSKTHDAMLSEISSKL